MTTITIERTILDRLIEAWDSTVLPTHRDAMMQERMEDLRAELAKPADITTEMAAVADRFAHRLALDLECVLADYSGTWYDTAISTLGAYRKAMNAIHERESPTFMGEPVLLDIAAPTPAWHAAPDVATLKAERDAAMKDAERYRWLTTHARTTSEHWGGRWSIVIDGPAPERHGCKEALDEAIDAAIAKAEEKNHERP